jgi:hypothetical protein
MPNRSELADYLHGLPARFRRESRTNDIVHCDYIQILAAETVRSPPVGASEDSADSP